RRAAEGGGGPAAGRAGDAAPAPAERTLDERRAAARALAGLDAVPVRDGRHPAREVRRDRLLTGGEQAEREPPGFSDEPERRRVYTQRDSDERPLDGRR